MPISAIVALALLPASLLAQSDYSLDEAYALLCREDPDRQVCQVLREAVDRQAGAIPYSSYSSSAFTTPTTVPTPTPMGTPIPSATGSPLTQTAEKKKSGGGLFGSLAKAAISGGGASLMGGGLGGDLGGGGGDEEQVLGAILRVAAAAANDGDTRSIGSGMVGPLATQPLGPLTSAPVESDSPSYCTLYDMRNSRQRYLYVSGIGDVGIRPGELGIDVTQDEVVPVWSSYLEATGVPVSDIEQGANGNFPNCYLFRDDSEAQQAMAQSIQDAYAAGGYSIHQVNWVPRR